MGCGVRYRQHNKTVFKLSRLGFITRRPFTKQKHLFCSQEMASSDVDEEKFSERAVEVWRACCGVPLATDAHITPGSSGGKVEVEVTWTQKDIERGKKIASNKSYFVEKDSNGGLRSLCASSFQASATNV